MRSRRRGDVMGKWGMCQRRGNLNRRQRGIRNGLRGNRGQVCYGNVEYHKYKIKSRGNSEKEEGRCDRQMGDEESV